ncbi:MAG TPA: histidine kinase N-terminal 7TM domain-containing protein, partial [Armatimonadota bacterium]
MLAVSLALFAAACYNLVLVVLILLKTPPRLVGRNVAWYLLCIAAWILTTAVLTHPAADHATALLATRAAYVCATIGVACWMLFCADLLPATRSFKRFAWVHIILGIPWLFLSWTDLIIADMSARPWGTHTVVGPLILLFGVWLAVGLTASITHLILCLRRTRGMQRLQIRYILLGTAVMGACGLLFNVVLPAVATSTDYAYCGPLSSVFMSSVTAYAIMRYRLLDIRIVLRAGLIYSITIGLLSLLFALLLPAFDRVFTFHLLPDTHTGSFLLAYFMALAYQPLRRRVQEAVDQHFFYEGIYDYRQSLREACHALAGQKDQQLILNTLIGVITQTLHPDGIAVYLPERDGVLSVVTSTRSRSALPNTLPPDSPVLVYAQQANDVILTEEQLRRADPHYSIGMQMHDWQIHAVIPLIANGHLSAIVFLGEKISGDVFFPEDSALLRTLGAQAALALDNVRQYEEMAEMNEYHQRLLNIMEDGVVALDPFGRVL